MKDYKARYQAIKQRGEELKLNLQDFMTRKTFLYFKNNFYANFSTIPLEDYLNIVKSDLEIGGEKLYPLLSLAISEIGVLPDDNPHKEIGYRLVSIAETRDTEHKEKHIIYYFPLELCYLFNPLGETLEETLARYINSFFKPKGLTKKALIELIKKDFNIYAYLFDIYFYGGYLLNDKPLEFEDLIGLYNSKLDTFITHLKADTKQLKEFTLRVIDEETTNYKVIEGEIKKEKEEVITPETRAFICNTLDNIPQELPPTSILEPYINDKNAHKLNYFYLNLSLIIANNKVLEDKEEARSDLQVIPFKDDFNKYLEAYSIIYKGVSTPKVSTSTIYKEKREEDTSLPTYITGDKPSDDILRAIQQYKPISNDEDLDYIQKYKDDYSKYELLKQEVEIIKLKLRQEQLESGYSSTSTRKIELELKEKLVEIDRLSTLLGERGTTKYAPNGYFLLDETYYKGFSRGITTYQVSPTASVVVISKNTELRADNDTLSQYNIETSKVLGFLLANSLKHNSYKFEVSNDEIERVILGDRYEGASLKDRDNARNQSFINSLKLLSRTTIETSFTPTEKQKAKGIKPRKRGGGSLLWYHNYTNYMEITLHPDIYAIAVKDFPIIPTSNEIYNLKPRAFVSALYLYKQCFYENSNQLKRSFNSLVDINPTYTTKLKDLSKNPQRLFLPILEDFEEMKEKNIILNYSPSLKNYERERPRLKLDDLISFKFNIDLKKIKH